MATNVGMESAIKVLSNVWWNPHQITYFNSEESNKKNIFYDYLLEMHLKKKEMYNRAINLFSHFIMYIFLFFVQKQKCKAQNNGGLNNDKMKKKK